MPPFARGRMWLARTTFPAVWMVMASSSGAAYTVREAPKPTEIMIAASFDAALNAGRLEEAIGLLAPDATVKDLSGRAITGVEPIRAWLKSSIDAHYHADAGIRQLSDGGRVTWTASVADDTLRALNAAPAAAFIEAIVVGDRIRSWVPRVMAGDRLKIQAAQAKAHEAVVRTLTDAVYGKGQLELLDRICATDFVDHDPYPGTPPTLAGFRQGIGLLRAACPGLTFAIEDVITGDDRVAFRGTLSGTQTGSLPGLAPSGRPFRVGTMDIVRLRDGRIAEHWGRIDTAGLRQQVQAAAPAPAVTPAKPAAPAPVSSPRK